MLQVVATEAEAATRASAASAPSTSATATAAVQRHDRVGVSARNWPYSRRICHQSVMAATGASMCTALIAAWIW
jgi:hypothetical protein